MYGAEVYTFLQAEFKFIPNEQVIEEADEAPPLDRQDTSQIFVESPALSFAFTDIKYGVKIPRGRTYLLADQRSFAAKLDLTCTVPCKDPPKERYKAILKGISGSIQAGESIAILGSSGAGKSTLLDVLARRIKEDSFTGQVTINGDNDLTYDDLNIEKFPEQV